MSFFIQTRLILRYRHSSPASRSQELSQLKTGFSGSCSRGVCAYQCITSLDCVAFNFIKSGDYCSCALIGEKDDLSDPPVIGGDVGDWELWRTKYVWSDVTAFSRLFQNQAPFLSITHANWWPILEITNALYWLQWIWGSYQTCPGGLPNCSGREYACRIVVVIFNKLILAWNLWKNIPNWSIWISLTPVSN